MPIPENDITAICAIAYAQRNGDISAIHRYNPEADISTRFPRLNLHPIDQLAEGATLHRTYNLSGSCGSAEYNIIMHFLEISPEDGLYQPINMLTLKREER